jgi:hypothetical protein
MTTRLSATAMSTLALASTSLTALVMTPAQWLQVMSLTVKVVLMAFPFMK